MTADIETRLARLERIVAGIVDEEPASERRSSLPPNDGRLIKTTGRDKQLNINVSQEVLDLVNEMTARFELSKAEFAEEAFKHMASKLLASENQHNGAGSRKKEEISPFLFRCTPARKAQLERLAAQIRMGSPEARASYTDTLNRALDCLEAVTAKESRQGKAG